MRGVRVAAALALAVLLASCSGRIIPPKELPDWAMNSQRGEAGSPVRAKTTQRTKAVPDQSADISFTKPMADVLPFSPEWEARENAFDKKLRRRMNICGGC